MNEINRNSIKKTSYHKTQIVKVNIKSKEQKEERQNQKVKLKSKSKKKKKAFLRLFAYMSIFTFVIFLVFSAKLGSSENSGSSWIYNLPIVKQIKHLAESADRGLKGQERKRINILLLGMGGLNHEGGLLTDTIMIVSIDTENDKIGLVSIPRDLSVPVENMGTQKINHINAYAEVSRPGSGGLAISQAVSDLLKIPIDYYLRVDFQGFINIVDELGGIKVYVENTLDDFSYPIMGNEEADWEDRFEHLHVEEGWQNMDGTLALKFSRSRHGINGEGSDFARAKRQQQILQAVKSKVLSMNTLLSPTKITGLINEYKNHVDTNLKIWEMIKLWDNVKNISRDNIISKVLDNRPNGLLVDNFTKEGSYVLEPRSGDYAEIQYFINNIFAEVPQNEKITITKDRATLEIRNGTWVNGLASQTALDLEKYGFIVTRIGNSGRQNFEKSVIYDLTYGEKTDSLSILRNKTNANIAYSLPEWLVNDIGGELELEKNPIKPDFILILGRNADLTESGVENTEEK